MPRSNVTLLGASASDEPEIFDQVKCGAGEAQPPATSDAASFGRPFVSRSGPGLRETALQFRCCF